MRDSISLFINGRLQEVRGADAFLTLADFVRLRLSLTGTKVVCAEGDCGSCTVLCGRPSGNEFCYLPIDSCIQFMFQLDGTHVVTVEGLTKNGQLTVVQEAMVECHGSQCGYCTPGFVMAMTALVDERGRDGSGCVDWRGGLTGNLCRCTGYTPILAAGKLAEERESKSINELYPPAAMLALCNKLATQSFEVVDETAATPRHIISPLRLSEAVAEKTRFPSAVFVAGATDVGVQFNKRQITPRAFIDLNRIADLDRVVVQTRDDREVLVAGARATWSQLAPFFAESVPEFEQIITVFGGPQIRHVGTLGGNLANASPIADSIPFLMVMDANLELLGPKGSRLVDVNEFFRGYKQLDMKPDELISEVRIPLPTLEEKVRLFKISRRRDLDISTLTAAFRLRLENDTVRTAKVAVGGVGPVVLRAPQTESFLEGKKLSSETMSAAGDIAVTEITPITDVRGSEEYRYQLTRNLFQAVRGRAIRS